MRAHTRQDAVQPVQHLLWHGRHVVLRFGGRFQGVEWRDGGESSCRGGPALRAQHRDVMAL